MFNLPSKLILPDPLLAKLNWLQKGYTRGKVIPVWFSQCDSRLTHFSLLSLTSKTMAHSTLPFWGRTVPQQSQLSPRLSGTVVYGRFIHLLLSRSWQQALVLFFVSILPRCARGSLVTSVITSIAKHSDLTAEIFCVPVPIVLFSFAIK